MFCKLYKDKKQMLLCPFMLICGKLPSVFHHVLKNQQCIPEAKQGHGKKDNRFLEEIRFWHKTCNTDPF